MGMGMHHSVSDSTVEMAHDHPGMGSGVQAQQAQGLGHRIHGEGSTCKG